MDVCQSEFTVLDIKVRVHDIILQLGQEQGREAGQEINKVGPGEHIQPLLTLSRILRGQDLQVNRQEQQLTPRVLIIRDGHVNDKQVRIVGSAVEDF